MTDNEYYNYLLSCGCGFTEDEAKEKVKEAGLEPNSEPKEPREITSATYKRAEKRLRKAANKNMGFDRR